MSYYENILKMNSQISRIGVTFFIEIYTWILIINASVTEGLPNLLMKKI